MFVSQNWKKNKMTTVNQVKKKRVKKTPVRAKRKVANDPEMNEVKIPSGASKPITSLDESVIAIYGNSGCGKTTLAAQFPGYVTAQFEPLRKGIQIRKVDMSYVSLSYYDRTEDRPFLKFCSLVEQSLEDPTVKGICIDTFALMFQSASDFVCHEGGYSSPNDANDYGKTWGKIQNLVRDILTVFLKSGKGLIFIDHSAAVETEVNSEKFKITQPNLTESKSGSMPILKEMTEMVMFYGLNANGTRYIQLHPTRNVYCKCAIDGHFQTPTGEQLKRFNVGNTPKKAYQDLIDAFNNKKSNPVKPTRKTSK
jgi:hypothetical protein